MLRRRPRLRRTVFAAAGLLGGLVVLVAGINLYMVLSEGGEETDSVAAAPHAQVAIVLGAYVEPGGRMSAMLADRVRQGAALYRAGKVDAVLVSGDHHRWSYDEPDTMRKALQADGVPAAKIFTDHAGFDTWNTMVRARRVFRVRNAIVVTQDFHMARALFLADAAGLHATGVNASLRGYGQQGLISDVREVFARVKAVGSATLNTPVIGGPPHPITGDGRKSWGEQRPMR